MSEPRTLTPKEVATALQVGLSTVYRLLDSGTIPSFRIAGCVRVDRAAFERWYERQQPKERVDRKMLELKK